jgi:predicted DNA-binding protein
MDTTRWKSILVPREVYEDIKELSKKEGRTIGGQLRLVFEWYMETSNDRGARDNGSVPQKSDTK